MAKYTVIRTDTADSLMKIMLDTNILISALVFGGQAGK